MIKNLRPFLLAGQVIFTLFLLYFAVRLVCYHFALVTFPYPNGLREGAMMTSTNALVHGLDPYDMSLQPQLMNPYGIVYPLIVWPFAALFGTTILIHRMVTAFFILASCAFIFYVLRRMNTSIILSIWSVLMLYASLLYPGTSTPTIDPGAVGMFFMLLTVFIPWLCRFSYRSLFVSILFGILAFYTKPYAFLGTIILSSYLFFFVSKKKGLIYGAVLLALSAISVVAVAYSLPAYFDDCFFTSLNMTHSWESMQRLYYQINLYSRLHQWTLLMICVFLIWHIFNRTKVRLQDPARHGILLTVWAGSWSAFVLYFSLGRHSGAMLWYFFQLLSPFLLVGAAWAFNRIELWPILCTPFLVLNLLTMTAGQDYKVFYDHRDGWPELTMVISKYQNILNSPLIASLLVEQGKPLYDNGQTEYFLSGAERNGWMRGFFKQDDRVYLQMLMFFKDIRSKIENKEFDLIILQPSLLPLGVGDEIKEFYKYEGQAVVYAPQDQKPYAVTLWRPL